MFLFVCLFGWLVLFCFVLFFVFVFFLFVVVVVVVVFLFFCLFVFPYNYNFNKNNVEESLAQISIFIRNQIYQFTGLIFRVCNFFVRAVMIYSAHINSYKLL